MMKKKIILLATLLMLITSVVSASSLNGEYKGNPIVKLKSSGSLIDTGEVPAMIYDGNTMVPIAALRNLGADVTWDQSTYSVDVNINKTQDTNTSKNDILKIKFYSYTSDYYYKLSVYGDMVTGLSNGFSLAFTGIGLGNNSGLKQAIDAYNAIGNRYPDLVNGNNAFTTVANQYSIDVSDTVGIIQSYADAMDYYKKALSALNVYSVSKSNSDFNEYLNNSNLGYNSAHTARVKANNQYNNYFTIVQNY